MWSVDFFSPVIFESWKCAMKTLDQHTCMLKVIVNYLGWQYTVALIKITIVDISNSLFVAARYPVEALVPDSAPRCQCRGP